MSYKIDFLLPSFLKGIARLVYNVSANSCSTMFDFSVYVL
jgi:hypothetical protein